jgi:hypothetical protein
MHQVVLFAVINIYIPAAGTGTTTGAARVIPGYGHIFKSIKIYIMELYGAVFYNTIAVHHLT